MSNHARDEGEGRDNDNMGKPTEEDRDNTKKRRFSERVEERARRVADSLPENGWDATPEATLERDIALTINHINGVKASQRAQDAELDDLESYFRTKLMQLWPGKDEHESYLWREQDKEKLKEKERWRERILELWEERRVLAGSLEAKLQPLHDRLLALLQAHVHLAPSEEERNRGHRKARK